MIFKVMSRRETEQFVQQKHDELYAVISISNTGGDFATIYDLAIAGSGMMACLPLAFDDVYVGESFGVPMSDQQAKDIISFVKLYFGRVDYFIIHCEAGQSRSAGVAAALSRWIEGEDWEYFLDPKYTPNSHCYQTIMEAIYGPMCREAKNELLHKVTVNQNLDLDWDIVYSPYGDPVHVGELKQ